MPDNASKLQATLSDSTMKQAIDHFPVLMPPSDDVLVVAVNRDEVRAPKGEIAAADMSFREPRLNRCHKFPEQFET